jgi:enediyne biosynthesis protein E4
MRPTFAKATVGKPIAALAAASLAVLATAHARDETAIFDEAAGRVGLTFVYSNGAAGHYYMPEVMGAGAALLDYDNDGDLDVYLLQGQSFDPNAPRDPKRTHRLFRNELVEQKSLRFTDVTAGSGLGGTSYAMGVATGDYDNDGDQDLYVTAFGSNTLYRNNGDGTFTDVTAAAGVDDQRWSTAATFVDYDGDGDLDLFVVNYLDFSTAANRQCFDPGGSRDYCGPRAFRPAPDRLFRNEGGGRFTDVTEAAGITKADGAGLGIATGDYNADGWPDLYVANDATPNQLWVNRKNGTFVDDGPLAGVALNAGGRPEGSMGIASGDYDRDGDEDLFVTNIIGETFALYTNDGHGGFEDTRVQAELARPTAGFTGFGTDWIDYDNDGWPDLFVANGAVNIVEGLRGDPVPYRMRNLLFRNLGTGKFAETSSQAGQAFSRAEVSRAAAFGDIDNDGDTDVLVTTNTGPVRLWLNQIGTHNSWLQVRLDNGPQNRLGLGALVHVEKAGAPSLVRRVRTDGSYLSAQDPTLQFGLGEWRQPVIVRVDWPGGVPEQWTFPTANQRVTLTRGHGTPTSRP